MDKKIMAIIIALVAISGIATVVYAKKIGLTSEAVTEIIPPTYQRSNPEVMFAEGAAFDKNTQESEQAVFLVMKYGTKENIYLIIGSQTYKMTEITNSTSNLGPGTKVLRYKSEDGNTLTILAQRFEQWGQIAISGDFKDYLIAFKPMYYYYPTVEPMYGETRSVPGIGKIPKEERKEFIEETRPVMKGLTEIAKKEGLNISDILQGQAKPIVEWTD